MAINFEVKGMLARLLATEDIIVEHKNVETACFNVQTRVLTLPMWEKATDNIYDLLLSHEAAHALYTPNEDWTQKRKIPSQFVNVVEDARIEKLIRRRYAGLSKTFFNGYKELSDDDFFDLKGEDLSTFNLADRINLYFKIGSHLQLTFTPEEQEIVELIQDCETFNDTLDAAEILFKYCGSQFPESLKISGISTEVILISSNENTPSNDSMPTIQISGDQSSESNTTESENNSQNEEKGEGQQTGDQNEENGENEGGGKPTEEEKGEDQQTGDQNEENGENEGGGKPTEEEKGEDQQTGKQNAEMEQNTSNTSQESSGSIHGSSIKIKTEEALNKSIKDLTSKDASENLYLELPDLDVDQIIVPNSDVHKRCSEFWAQNAPHDFYDADSKYKEFKISSQREVNFLVKEFEARKAADAYVRASVSRTGVLNCSKLHTYMFNGDLFKKIMTFPDGKNHGLLFVLDWSGSMDVVMEDTIRQLYNLIWFCKKVSIPFEVYAFTNDYPNVRYDKSNGGMISTQSYYTPKYGLIEVNYCFSMMQLFTSKVNSYTLDLHMKNIYRIVYSLQNSKINYKIPSGLRLSGTPLNEALISLHKILPRFQNDNNLQKVQCVVLTDGDASAVKYYGNSRNYYTNNPTLTPMHIPINSNLRNRKTGNIYNFENDWKTQTTTFIRNLRDSFPNTNFIGIRLLGGDISYFLRRYNPEPNVHKKMSENWRKYKSCNLKDVAGYHSYFAIYANILSNDSQFKVPDNASKSQIKGAFIKSLKNKKTNKKILAEFMDLVV